MLTETTLTATDETHLDNLTLDEQIEMAEFGLKCAQSHLDELLAEKAEIDAANEQAELDAWADANAPEDIMIDRPSQWEVENGIC